MKIYQKEKEDKKSWAISLYYTPSNMEPCLVAVDSKTGDVIATLLVFKKSGETLSITGSRGIIEVAGYDPSEHKTIFNIDGTIEIGRM